MREKWIGTVLQEREILFNLTDRFEVLTTSRLQREFTLGGFYPR